MHRKKSVEYSPHLLTAVTGQGGGVRCIFGEGVRVFEREAFVFILYTFCICWHLKIIKMFLCIAFVIKNSVLMFNYQSFLLFV